MNKKALESFIKKIPKGTKKAKLIDYFLYFLSNNSGIVEVTPSQIEKCFVSLDLYPYSNIPKYLLDHSKRNSKTKLFLKSKNGYRLERGRRFQLEVDLGQNQSRKKVVKELRQLLLKVNIGNERDFLEETIMCLENNCSRGAIVLAWILVIDHMQGYVYSKKLTEFNTVLSKNKDRRIKISIISSKDDFSEIPENKLIEFMRTAKIITNDVRKILETKLGIRNTSAHPSAVKVSEIKATEFVEDLVLNVINKYK